MNTKMTKVIGIVAVLALIAVAFVGAGAATNYIVADNGTASSPGATGAPMSTTAFLNGLTTTALSSSDTVTVETGYVMTVPSGSVLKLNGATLTITDDGGVVVNGGIEAKELDDISGKFDLNNSAVYTVTDDPTNLLSNVQGKIDNAAVGTSIVVKPSASAAGAKWVVTTACEGSEMEEGINVTITNLDPTSQTGSTVVGYDNPVTYTVTIPETVTLTTENDDAASAAYKITIGSAAGSETDNRAVVIKLAKAANLSGGKLHVKNVNGTDTVEYHMFVTDSYPGKFDVTSEGTAIAAAMVSGTKAAIYDSKTWQTPSSKTVTSNVSFGNYETGKGVSFDYAGKYEDTLTFSVGIESATPDDRLELTLTYSKDSTLSKDDVSVVWKDSNDNVVTSIRVNSGVKLQAVTSGALGHISGLTVYNSEEVEQSSYTLTVNGSSSSYSDVYIGGVSLGSSIIGSSTFTEVKSAGTLTAKLYGSNH